MPAPKLRKGGRALLMKALREIKKHPKSFHIVKGRERTPLAIERRVHEWLKTGL